MNKSQKLMNALENFLETAFEKHLAASKEGNEWEQRETSEAYSEAYLNLRKTIQEILPPE